MMTNEITYKVLWVDDQEEIVESTKLDADEYGIELDHYSNWQEAEVALKKDFEEYSAIILDAFCQINPNEGTKEEFITSVLPSITGLFGEKKKYIPWYILSAGTMDNFSFVVKSAAQQHLTSEWGNMLYFKERPDNDPQNSSFLFQTIQEVAKRKAYNTVLFRHKDVFSYLGKDKLIDERARKAMLKMLSALYYPEENIKYEYAGNPLRKVVEYIFRSARKQGFLTADCFDSNDRIVLLDASRYLSGMTINCYEGRTIKYQARWGEPGAGKDGAGGESVFPSDISMLVKNILNYSSSDSHTYEDEPYFIDAQAKELFFGYVMQLCHVIKWYGNYAAGNPNFEENKKKHRIIAVNTDEQKQNRKTRREESRNTTVKSIQSIPPSSDDLKGKRYLIMKEGATLFCGSCKLDATIPYKSGQVVIDEVVPNEGDDKVKYPFIATKVTIVK